MSTTKSGNSSGCDGKGGGAREWVRNKLKALPGIIGSI